MGFISIVWSWYMGDDLFWGKFWTYNALDFQTITIEGSLAQEFIMFYPLKQTFDHSNSSKNGQNACAVD